MTVLKKHFMKYILILLIPVCLMSYKVETPSKITNVRIGALVSVSGNWSTLGIASQEAINIAINDVNTHMQETGSLFRFSVTTYDTKMDPGLALASVKQAYKNGIRFIVGPQSSAEVKAVKSFIDANHMILISQGSTAGSLAIANDGIFRFCASDAAQGDAMAQAIYAAGIRSIVSVARDDEGNKELSTAVNKAFIMRGGKVAVIKPFDPLTTDFSKLLQEVKTKIEEQTAILGDGKVAVYLASFDKVKELFEQAAADSSFPIVHWYGGDGITLSKVLLSDAVSASFAAKSQFFSPRLGLPQQVSPELERISTLIKAKTGLEADAYALAAYDAVWVIAQTVTNFPTPSTDYNLLKQVFQKEANQYFGITGPILLNEAGDRSIAAFEYWGISSEAGSYQWQFKGKSL